MARFLDIAILVVFAVGALAVWFIPSISSNPELKKIARAADERRAERLASEKAEAEQAERERMEGPVYILPLQPSAPAR